MTGEISVLAGSHILLHLSPKYILEIFTFKKSIQNKNTIDRKLCDLLNANILQNEVSVSEAKWRNIYLFRKSLKKK